MNVKGVICRHVFAAKRVIGDHNVTGSRRACHIRRDAHDTPETKLS